MDTVSDEIKLDLIIMYAREAKQLLVDGYAEKGSHVEGAISRMYKDSLNLGGHLNKKSRELGDAALNIYLIALFNRCRGKSSPELVALLRAELPTFLPSVDDLTFGRILDSVVKEFEKWKVDSQGPDEAATFAASRTLGILGAPKSGRPYLKEITKRFKKSD